MTLPPLKKAAEYSPEEVKELEEEYAEIESQLKEEVAKFLEELKTTVEPTTQQFNTAVSKAIELLAFAPIDMARGLHISLPTIKRWADGSSAPHPIGRLPVFKWIVSTYERKMTLDKLTQMSQDFGGYSELD